MVCFSSGKHKDQAEATDLFLFVIDKDKVKHAPASPAPEIAQALPDMATAGWSSGGKAYVLAARGDTDFIGQYLR